MSDWNRTLRLYVAEFRNGLVKVGITAAPGDRRIRSLQHVHGPIVRYHFCAPHSCMGYSTEGRLCERMGRIASLHKGREFFTGVRFNVARQLAEQINRPQPVKSSVGDVNPRGEAIGVLHSSSICPPKPINANQLCREPL